MTSEKEWRYCSVSWSDNKEKYYKIDQVNTYKSNLVDYTVYTKAIHIGIVTVRIQDFKWVFLS